MADQQSLDQALGVGTGGDTKPSIDDALGVSAGAPPAAPTPSPLRRYGAMAVRGGLTAGGALLGSLLGPLGTAGGGAAGAGLGEYLGEKIEGRQTINPWEVAGSTALGAIPLGGELSLGKAALKSGLVGGGDTLMRQQAEQGLHVPSADELESAVASGGLSAATGGLLHKVLGYFRGASTPAATAEARPSPPVAPTTAPVPAEPGAWSLHGPANTTEMGPVTRTEQISGIDPQRLVGTPGAPTRNSPPVTTSRFGSLPKPLADILDATTANDRAADAPPLGLPTHDTAGTPHFDEVPENVSQQGLPLSGRSDQPDLVMDNGSGAPGGGSAEELARTASMRDKGQTFVKYDRAGGRQVVGNDPGAQDMFAKPGETFGVEDADGNFSTLDDNGGKVPITAQLPKPLRDILTPAAPIGDHETFDLGGGPGETTTDDILNMAEERPRALPVPDEAPAGPPSASPAIRALYDKLFPKWVEDRQKWDLATGTPHTPNEPTPEDFEATVRNEPDPSQLMGGERKIRKQIDSGELGAASTRVLAPLAGGTGGALIGGATNPDHPIEGAVTGAAIGAGIPLAVQNPALFNKYRYASMLGSPTTILKKGLGDSANAVIASIERMATGDTAGGMRILRSFFSPETAQGIVDHFKSNGIVNPDHTFGADTTGLMGIPSRLLGAITDAAQDAHMRAGVSQPEAERLTGVGALNSQAARGLMDLTNKGGPLVDAVMPFSRVALNWAEQGGRMVPGAGMAPLLMRAMQDEPIEPGEWKSALAKQGLGALATAYGLSRQAPDHKTGVADRLFHTAMGPAMVPEEIGEALAAASRAKGAGPNAELNAGVKSFVDNLPIPTDVSDFYPSQLLAQLVPTGLTALSQTKPSDFDQDEKNNPFGPAIARIPILNDLLLRARPHPPTAVR